MHRSRLTVSGIKNYQVSKRLRGINHFLVDVDGRLKHMASKISVASANVEAVRELIEHDRRITNDGICSKVNISYRSVVFIVRKQLKFRRITAT